MKSSRRISNGNTSIRASEVAKCCLGSGSDPISWLIRMDHFSGATHAHQDAQVSIPFSASPTLLTQRAQSGKSVDQPLTPGSIVYFPTGDSHCIQWSQFTELLNFYWNNEYLRELADQIGCRLPEDAAQVRVDPAIAAVGEIVRDDFLWAGTMTPMLIDHSRTLIAARLFRLFTRSDRASTAGLLSGHRLQRAVDALVGSPERCFTLVELACLCNSSVFHFAHSFKAHVGMAPFAFQRHLRIQKARALLSRTDLTIEEIGNAVGCENASSFSRMFRNVTSQSPGEFRGHHRAELKTSCRATSLSVGPTQVPRFSLQTLLETEDQAEYCKSENPESKPKVCE